MHQKAEFRLWTFTVKGPHRVAALVEGNPPIEHGGGMTVAHLVLREIEVPQVKAALKGDGNTVDAWEMEGQTGEQQAERQAFHLEDRVWPCAACPSCPWVELSESGSCGLKVWPPESIETLRSTSETHRQAELSCPVGAFL